MIWHRLTLIVALGTALILSAIAIGTALLLHRTQQLAQRAEEIDLERTSLAVENALSRQLLQVHGALASLPTLFAAAEIAPTDARASQLLRGLDFQTLAFRDLLLVGPDGALLTSARARRLGQPLAFDNDTFRQRPATLIGPVRNRITGDWSLYFARTVPGWNGIIPVAEVPIPILMKLLSESGLRPGVRILLERPNGQLIAALPHDELRTGRLIPDALGTRPPSGIAFETKAPEGPSPDAECLAVVRASIEDDLRIVLTLDLSVALADWARERDRVIIAAATGALLIAACAAALLFALRQRERAEAERTRAAAVLANAIEAMSDGFIMWDADDRLVTCNQRYRDLHALSERYVVIGGRYEDLLRAGAEIGQFPEAQGDIDGFVARTVAWHRQTSGSVERRLPDGRWVLARERRTADGGIVGIRTDITTLKTALAELAEANTRANEAAAETRRQNQALIERERQIRFLAHHDDLTGLPNRVYFRDCVEFARRTAGERGLTLALLYLDLDRFKDVNDTLGHPIGDALLQTAAGRLRDCVDNPERVSRLGGDEFAVISLSASQPAAAEALSTRILESLGAPYEIFGHTLSISVSVGIAIADGPDDDADALLKQADVALYQAKAKGRGTYCMFVPDMDRRLRARLEMEADLHQALAGNQFELAYQPVHTLDPERLCGFEALLRWHHPRHGLISPAEFIPLAEETRLIVSIGAWVLRQACTDAMRLPSHLKIAVNLSPVQLAAGDIVEAVPEILRETGLDPARLELEITETALFANNQHNMDALRHLRALGTRIVLDDFGTGFSSLSHVHRFPLDKIKIDRSFVQDMTVRSDSAVIVETIATLARRLGMGTTAEGIETPEQKEAARRAGCTEAQGFLLGRPQPIADALRLAVRSRR